MLTPQVWMGDSRNLAIQVAGDNGFSLDIAVWKWLQTLRRDDDPWVPALTEIVRDATAVGSNLVLSLVVFGVAGFLFLSREKSLAIWLLVTVVTALLLNHGLKEFIDRARPDELAQAARVFTPSFPSAHAMLSATVYSAVAVIAGTRLSSTQTLFVFAVAGLLIVMVGFSRLYLGVHWTTDVVGGWAFGLVWTWASWQLFQRYSRQRLAAEQPFPEKQNASANKSGQVTGSVNQETFSQPKIKAAIRGDHS